MRRIRASALVALLAAAPAAAQTDLSTARPRIGNGTVTDQSAAGGLSAAVKAIASRGAEPAWIGYAVALVDGDHDMCCWGDAGYGRLGGCRLEPVATDSRNRLAPTPPPQGAIPLEPARALVVMLRLEGGRVERIRTFSESCALDAGGRAVSWLTGVRPADSVAFLGGYAHGSEARKLESGALAAIAMHAAPQALDWLLATARSGGTAHQRSQSLFWLAQRAGQRAVGAIASAIDDDPDTEVKKKAVFALSQLPPDDGVPRLITVARSHSNPAVRKQAFFWLGQSKDPRALAFITEVLTR